LIIVGFKKSLGIKFKPPRQTHLNRYVSVKEAIEVPPINIDALNNERTAQSQQVIKRLSFIKPGENAWTAQIPKAYQLNVKGAKLSQIYKRLDPDKPSYTITGSGGGGTHVYHWEENRALTNRERARLQSFPDNFEFIGSKESVRRQIGMAVPPKGAKIIFEAIFKSLKRIEYDFLSEDEIHLPGLKRR
jgi:DNA (cytosine-5)-methyltransferase 1